MTSPLQALPLSPAHRAAAPPAAIAGSLVDVLRTEHRLVDDLIAILHRQRGALAADDLASVEQSSYSLQRALFTLGEARRRRRGIGRLLGGGDLALRELDTTLGDQMTAELRDVRDALHVAARALAGEVDTNRRILRHALANNREYASRLAGAPAGPSYGERGANAPARPGLLLDRRS